MTAIAAGQTNPVYRNPMVVRQEFIDHVSAKDPARGDEMRRSMEFGDYFSLQLSIGIFRTEQRRAGLVDYQPVHLKIKSVGRSTAPVQISAAARTLAAQDYQESLQRPASLQAIDIDSVLKQSAKIGRDSLDDYVGYLKSYQRQNINNPNGYSFIGSYGPDRMTTDLDEYLGWLHDAAVQAGS